MERLVPSLPAIDTSKEAWAFVAAGFTIETLLWGGLFSTGVFLKHYVNTPPFSSASATKISLIGTISLFIGYSAGVPLLYLYNRNPRAVKPTIWIGLGVFVGCVLAASWVRNVDALIVLQGVGPGIAGAFCAFPVIRWVPDWFDKRRGLAAGVIFSGGGVGGAYMPVLNQYLIDKVGLGWTLRISALSTGLLVGIAIMYVRPRVQISPNQQVGVAPMPSAKSTFSSAGFVGVFLSTLLQGIGFFIVNLFIPRFSETLSSTAAAGLLSAFNVSCIFAQILWGFLTDVMQPSYAMALSSTAGSCCVLTLWGFGARYGLAMFIPFAIAFGTLAGGFTAMWSQCASRIAGPDKEKQTLLISGFSLARGVGAVLGPTIGAAMYRESGDPHDHGWGSAGSPALLALVAASLAASAGVAMVWPYINRLIASLASSADHGVISGGYVEEILMDTKLYQEHRI